jgi:RNA polymerase sigma-70 factor (ECF subfamily)
MDEPQEREIAIGLGKGNADAWRALYDAYAERTWRAVARLMGATSADVADVVQETFLAAARSAPTYDFRRGPLWGWLWGIARRQVALHYRKRGRHERAKSAETWLSQRNGQLLGFIAGSHAAPAEALESAELATLVRTALAELSTEYESLLTARYLDGDSVDQIAARDHSTSTAVRSKLARARQAFRRVLENYSALASERT